MKILAVSALVCAFMALTAVADAAEEEPENAEEEELEVAKRTGCSSVSTEPGQHDFLYISEQLTWAEAQENCKSLGKQLASVHSRREHDQIKAVIASGGGGHKGAWLGGSDGHSEGEWHWTDGTCFGYTNWCHGEPNNVGVGQNCLQMIYSAQKCWDDLWCHWRIPSVCASK